MKKINRREALRVLLGATAAAALPIAIGDEKAVWEPLPIEAGYRNSVTGEKIAYADVCQMNEYQKRVPRDHAKPATFATDYTYRNMEHQYDLKTDAMEKGRRIHEALEIMYCA